MDLRNRMHIHDIDMIMYNDTQISKKVQIQIH